MSLIKRIIRKIAQEQPEQKPLGNPPSVPEYLFSNLDQGYNPGTVAAIKQLTNILNTALHYASAGKDSFQEILNNNLDLSGAVQNHKNVGLLGKMIFSTFLNNKNSFAQKVTPNVINQWCVGLINSNEYSSLTQTNPTGQLANKIQGNLKTLILDIINAIKQQNILK